ncbi:AAA family ATPase [Candidatus Parcubacteria bacterium]|nr:AAA family ATPase [Candidatus Parcubacteria bacterium]
MKRLIGHEKTKRQIFIAAQSAIKRNKAIPHILFTGTPGCGKTSMAKHLATIFKLPFLSVVPNDMKDYKSVISVLEKLNHEKYDRRGNRVGRIVPTLLFFDEIHNLPLKGQELLGLAMEKFVMDSGKPNKYYWTPFFTLIGATTVAGKLSKPFLDRFKMTFIFEPYPFNEMVEIVKMHANKLGVEISTIGAQDIAKRGRGIPRTVVGYTERIRDKVIAIDSTWATSHLIKDVFKDMGIDEEGLTITELKILTILFNSNIPVSLDNLSIITEEDSKTIKFYAEPFLIRKGFILISGKGRILTEKGREYIINSNHAIKKFQKDEIDFGYQRK